MLLTLNVYQTMEEYNKVIELEDFAMTTTQLIIVAYMIVATYVMSHIIT